MKGRQGSFRYVDRRHSDCAKADLLLPLGDSKHGQGSRSTTLCSESTRNDRAHLNAQGKVLSWILLAFQPQEVNAWRFQKGNEELQISSPLLQPCIIRLHCTSHERSTAIKAGNWKQPGQSMVTCEADSRVPKVAVLCINAFPDITCTSEGALTHSIHAMSQ